MSELEIFIGNFNVFPDKNIYLKKLNSIELLKYDVTFEIRIDNQLFFYDESFALLDLLYQLYEWKISLENVDFVYNSIETEDNPLLSLLFKDKGYSISSAWKLFSSDAIFSKEQIIQAFEKAIPKQIVI